MIFSIKTYILYVFSDNIKIKNSTTTLTNPYLYFYMIHLIPLCFYCFYTYIWKSMNLEFGLVCQTTNAFSKSTINFNFKNYKKFFFLIFKLYIKMFISQKMLYFLAVTTYCTSRHTKKNQESLKRRNKALSAVSIVMNGHTAPSSLTSQFHKLSVQEMEALVF